MEKIRKFKQVLKKEKLDGYLIPKNDEFFGENVANSNDRLNYITNFDGSFGFALILRDKNYLFVDGRYTLQAQKQSGKFFEIITIPNRLPNDILKNKKLLIGFDPKLFTKKTISIYFSKNNCKFKSIERNLVDDIWKRRSKKNKHKFYCLPGSSAENYKSKINKVVSNLNKIGADFQFITACENNAWLLNIRGNDATYAPIPNSYILVNRNKKIIFFCDLSKISLVIKKRLSKITFIKIESLNKILSTIINKKFIIDKNTCSIFFENKILKKNKIINFQDCIYNLKSIKNTKEINNIKLAHIYDGIALTKYIFWIKNNFLKKKITELSGSSKLLKLREKNKKFKSLSFPTISGTGPNGAIIHYKPSKKTNRRLKRGEIYLVDSGGQYEFGTTDVTRTISLKNKSKKIKDIFTRVLKGHIAVAKYNLKDNTSGSNIDNKARKYLRKIGLNYAHGTGHGVGYFLNVHEGPQAISKNNKIKLKVGMVISNEPGYYEKNKFGMRIENLIYIKRRNNKNIFENLTMAPIDKDLIIQDMLSNEEKKWLNNYHKKVFNNLKGAMNRGEIIELKKACSAI